MGKQWWPAGLPDSASLHHHTLGVQCLQKLDNLDRPCFLRLIISCMCIVCVERDRESVCARTHTHVHIHRHAYHSTLKVGEQPVVVSFLVPWRFQELNTDHQVQCRAILPAEPPLDIFKKTVRLWVRVQYVWSVWVAHARGEAEARRASSIFSTLLLQGTLYPWT